MKDDGRWLKMLMEDDGRWWKSKKFGKIENFKDCPGAFGGPPGDNEGLAKNSMAPNLQKKKNIYSLILV